MTHTRCGVIRLCSPLVKPLHLVGPCSITSVTYSVTIRDQGLTQRMGPLGNVHDSFHPARVSPCISEIKNKLEVIVYKCKKHEKMVIERWLSGDPSSHWFCEWPEKTCPSCKEQKVRDKFHNAKHIKKDQKDFKCKDCRKIGKIKRKYDGREVVPEWLPKSERKKLSQFYRDRPEGYHVDHIVPLRGETVSGLHVPWNLQYLPANDNQSKGNRWWPDMW